MWRLTTPSSRFPRYPILSVAWVVTAGSGVRQLLADVFDAAQLDMIEAAFEGSISVIQIGYTYGASKEELEAAVTFGRKHNELRARLRAILNNIIEHKGFFVPGE